MWYDLMIFALLLFCLFRGASKGFAWQIATIGSLVLCFLFAETASLVLAPLIKVDPPLNRWIAMFALYIGASFVSFSVARTIRKTLEAWQFQEYDRHLGAVFGLVKGVGFALVITFFVVTLSPSMRNTVLTSYSGHYAGQILVALHPVLPDEFHGVVDPYLENLGHAVVHDDDFGHHPGADDGTGDGSFGNDPNTPPPPHTPDFGQYPGGQGSAPADDFGPAPSGNGWPVLPTGHMQAQPAPTGSGTGRPQSGGSELSRLANSLPPGLTNDVRDLALKALQNTRPEDRAELMKQFQTAIPGLIKATATEWSRGKPATADKRTPREKTLREIAAIYTENLDGQQWIIQEAEKLLQGVPDDVALVVVQDWYADLLSLTPDPDPNTDLSTRVEVRIVRQLKSFQVPLDSLRADVRNRLGVAIR